MFTVMNLCGAGPKHSALMTRQKAWISLRGRSMLPSHHG